MPPAYIWQRSQWLLTKSEERTSQASVLRRSMVAFQFANLPRWHRSAAACFRPSIEATTHWRRPGLIVWPRSLCLSHPRAMAWRRLYDVLRCWTHQQSSAAAVHYRITRNCSHVPAQTHRHAGRHCRRRCNRNCQRDIFRINYTHCVLLHVEDDVKTRAILHRVSKRHTRKPLRLADLFLWLASRLAAALEYVCVGGLSVAQPARRELVMVAVALCNRQTIIFSSCFFFLLLSSSFFPRLISAVGDWMFTILWHMVCP